MSRPRRWYRSYDRPRSRLFSDLPTSYGLVLVTYDEHERCERYLVCQRRDSIAYAEFLKNNLADKDIARYVPFMTKDEIARCIEMYMRRTPDRLWDDLWVNHQHKMYTKHRDVCTRMFMTNMDKWISVFQTTPGRPENTWGFPKGRKKPSESNLECAIRECEEETGIARSHFTILPAAPPIEEVYRGTDDRFYKTVYYLAYVKTPGPVSYIASPYLPRSYITDETSVMEWATYPRARARLDESKRKVLRRANLHVLFTRPKMHRRSTM